MEVRHLSLPSPTMWELGAAISRRGLSPLEVYLLAVSAICLAVLEAPGVALVVLVLAILVEVVLDRRSRALMRNWRQVRRRRKLLNGEESRDRRAALLADRLTELVEAANRAWKIYIADAVVGRTHSVINDRPAPKVDALRRLERLPVIAEELGITLVDDADGTEAAIAARLPVPPSSDFKPDVLSPTMMNLNAASIAHARAEGPARASRRHDEAVALASEFAPRLVFAERAIAALRPTSGLAHQR